MNAPLGTHLLVELRQANPEKLDDIEFIRNALISAAQEVGATIVGDTFHRFSPQGVTGVVAIAESHISIHTWPEHCYAAVDVFVCGDSLVPEKAANLIIKLLDCKDPEILKVTRGKLPAYVD